MNDLKTLDEIEKQAFRYDAQDGFTEFLGGIMFFFIARSVVDPHLVWVPPIMIFVMRWANRFFKERFTYPRIGYVKLRKEDGRAMGRGMLGYLGIVLAMMTAALWLTGHLNDWGMWRKWMPALAGGLSAGAFFYLAARSGLLRHRLLSVFPAVWGVVCSLKWGHDFSVAFSRWALGVGLVTLLMGIVVFLVFLRTHPVRNGEVADERG